MRIDYVFLIGQYIFFIAVLLSFLPAALIGLLIVLICYYRRSTISWSPNNDSKQQPNYNVAENGNVTVNSIRSFDSYVA